MWVGLAVECAVRTSRWVGPALQSTVRTVCSVKATVENPRGSVEKLPPKESVEGADTVLLGSVRDPKEFSEGKPIAAKPRRRSPQEFAAEGLLEENSKTLLLSYFYL